MGLSVLAESVISWVLPFFPRRVTFLDYGSEGAKNLAGDLLRLIQIRLATPSLEKAGEICKHESLPANHVD